MVQPILKGRMGNQMFQIAAAIGYAEKHHMGVFVPQQTADQQKWPVYFNHFPRYAAGDVITGTVYKEKGFEYEEIPAMNNVFLDGYFQSEKYFSHCADRIRRAFVTVKYFMDKGSVSLHVRRGDYLMLPNHHPTQNEEYYNRAINSFRAAGYKHFEVFSDDMDWCMQNINVTAYPDCKFGYNVAEPQATELLQAHIDMAKMASCDHHIIANSSFSWWGAWLNPNPNKKVLAPKQWFGPALDHLNTKDLIPEGWKTI